MSKNTITYSLLLPIMVIIFHAIVPHSHHLNNNIIHFESLSDNQNNYHLPIINTEHCHAFNEVILFVNTKKIINNINNIPQKFHYQLSYYYIQTLQYIITQQKYIEYEILSETRFKINKIFNNNIFRGPPFFKK